MEQIITHPRHEQLRGISKEFRKFFSIDCEGLGKEEQHKLLGYCKQLNIIANELEDTSNKSMLRQINKVVNDKLFGKEQ